MAPKWKAHKTWCEGFQNKKNEFPQDINHKTTLPDYFCKLVWNQFDYESQVAWVETGV